MDFEQLIAKVGVYAASFVVGFVSGLVPFVNSEVFLLLVSPITAKPGLVPVALLSALGQMGAKSILFYAGRGVLHINMGRLEGKIEAVQQKFADWENKTDALILLSAAVGLPPFYVVSFVAGALRLNFVKFFAVGYVGRSVRFAAIVYFPQLILKYL